MSAELDQKTEQYESMLKSALSEATVAVPPETALHAGATEVLNMAEAYLQDGQHFYRNDDLVNALAAFSYGYGWLDAGVRLGLFNIPADTELFTT
ncbi:MAG: uncharacterized protein conserved in archaea [Haloquadratum sp. J07HQX50]|jgi:Uncharacterized protein conserved in archaea|nr:MAG: uncharacterized protein conserved in archaea [Haloquadratum sp. J07HQX50]